MTFFFDRINAIIKSRCEDTQTDQSFRIINDDTVRTFKTFKSYCAGSAIVAVGGAFFNPCLLSLAVVGPSVSQLYSK